MSGPTDTVPVMPTFSQRAGYTTPRSVIQHEALDDETRVGLWNIIVRANHVLGEAHRGYIYVDMLATIIWSFHFKKPSDERPSEDAVFRVVKKQILEGPWFSVLDMIEAYIDDFETCAPDNLKSFRDRIVEALNDVFVSGLVDCRFIDGQLIQVGTAIEVDAITDALTQTEDFGGARQSIKRAADLLSDRSNPDYLNSIKESISAVESVVVNVTGKKTLGAGLKQLTDNGVSIHPALEQAWNKMYGWTSDADGIRHAAIEESESSQAMAKYMLVTCAAFVSYLIETGHKADLI
jgi:hypothetical protein